ncbi:hypothetical protein [Ehrlichia ruminantium]|nr:hypothetical protein [Ehrlichia ruminantium]
MLLRNDYVKDQFIIYKKFTYLPSIISRFFRKPKDKTVSSVSSTINQDDIERDLKEQIIAFFAVTLHVLMFNTLFFFLLFDTLSRSYEGIFDKIGINLTSNRLLNCLISSVVMSGLCLFFGYVIHYVVKRDSQHKGLARFVSTVNDENELLCTGVSTFFGLLVLHVNKKLLDFVTASKVSNNSARDVTPEEREEIQRQIMRLYTTQYSTDDDDDDDKFITLPRREMKTDVSTADSDSCADAATDAPAGTATDVAVSNDLYNVVTGATNFQESLSVNRC